jgi:hypothetical protein
MSPSQEGIKQGAQAQDGAAAMLATHADRWDWAGLSQNEAMPWSQAWVDAFPDQWDWERLSANPALFAALAMEVAGPDALAAFIARYADRWNWATLSGQVALPWSQALYRQCADHAFAHLVAQHQDFGVCVLPAEAVGTLLAALDSGDILPGANFA